MQQTAHRTSLGASPRRPSIGTPLSRGGVPVPLGGVNGINSRVQDTGYLLSHYGRGVSGINSRVQDTGYPLSHFSQGAPASTAPASTSTPRRNSSSALGDAARAGVIGAGTAALRQGLGLAGASWLTQGLILSAGAEFISRLMQPADMETAEREAKLQELERKLDNPFKGSGVVGQDQFLVIQAPPNGLRGLGSTGTVGAGINTGVVLTQEAIKTAAATGTSIGSGSTWLAAAGGPIGLAVAGATVALVYLLGRKRPQRKVATTEIVNEVEPLLQQNLDGYLAGPRTVSSQAQALANFDAGWQFVVDNCGIPDMGKPGEWCVNDRKRGGQWDWFKRYRDPIANDPAVVEDPAPDIQTMIDPDTGERVYVESPGSLGNMMPLIMGAGLLAVAVMFMGED